MTVLRPLAQPLSILSGVCSSVCSCVCLHPQPSPSPLHVSTSHLTSPRSGNFHTNVLIMQTPDSISSYQHPARGQRMILYFLTESNMNHTAADTAAPRQTPRQNWKMCGVAPHKNFLFSLFPPQSPILSAHGASAGEIAGFKPRLGSVTLCMQT